MKVDGLQDEIDFQDFDAKLGENSQKFKIVKLVALLCDNRKQCIREFTSGNELEVGSTPTTAHLIIRFKLFFNSVKKIIEWTQRADRCS